ncbi:MAG: preprotein translocase subunit YajC [Bifidobacteriaceae bacterium]|nr:preprotein translocase subunit YajC [Bifidobacteriaceae bacterium]
MTAFVLSAIVGAAEQGQAPTGGGNTWFTWILLGGVAVAMWFGSRRSKKKQAARDAISAGWAPGQRVVTVSGMVGTVTQIEGNIITLASASGAESQWVRRAIRELVDDEAWDDMTAERPDEETDEADGSEPDAPDDEIPGDGNDPGITRY